MIKYILSLIFPSLYIQFANTFYFGKKKLPISLKKNYGEKYTAKLGSGFASYTLETNKNELESLASFIQTFIQNNK